MKRQRAEISSNVISHIKSAHPIEMWRSNKLGIKEKISRGKFPRLIFSCPVPSGLPHRSHCVPMNMNRWNYRVFTCRVLTEKMRSGKFQASVASYIEFYNTKRPHCTLKNLTPCQAEENFNKNAKWDSGVRIAWLLCFLLQFEVVWVFSSQIFHGASIPKNAVMSRLSAHKTAPPNSQVSSTCSN